MFEMNAPESAIVTAFWAGVCALMAQDHDAKAEYFRQHPRKAGAGRTRIYHEKRAALHRRWGSEASAHTCPDVKACSR